MQGLLSLREWIVQRICSGLILMPGEIFHDRSRYFRKAFADLLCQRFCGNRLIYDYALRTVLEHQEYFEKNIGCNKYRQSLIGFSLEIQRVMRTILL